MPPHINFFFGGILGSECPSRCRWRFRRSSDMIHFLYHALMPPRPAPRAAHRVLRSAASTLRHPPSRQPVHLNQIPLVSPLCARPADDQCAYHRIVSAGFVSAPGARSRPQRTYSIRPLFTSALGAIIIVPPVNLLLLKVRNKQRRRSNSVSASTRTGNGRLCNRARPRKIEMTYPNSPCALKRRARNVATSAGNPTLNRLM